jgi:hypothetical protein
MDAKLTIKLDKDVIYRAKGYASQQKRSLSRIIESYLNSVVSQAESSTEGEIQISPFVKSMSSGVQIPADIDAKKEYGSYHADKYK